MAIDMTIGGTHAVAFPSRVVAGYGGGHIYDILLTSDADNGNIVGRGDYIKLGTYKETTPTSFAGKIVEQATNGNWYVEVTADTDALFVYMPEISPYETRQLRSAKVFYNASGDTVKGYSLQIGDIVEVSSEGFIGAPKVGKSISAISSKKFSVTAASTMTSSKTEATVGHNTGVDDTTTATLTLTGCTFTSATSSNTNIATVAESSGTLTITGKAVGTCTITVKGTGSAGYDDPDDVVINVTVS